MAAITLSPEGEVVLRRAVASIEADLRHWDQRHYVGSLEGDYEGCGTTMCLGGWIAFNERCDGDIRVLMGMPSVSSVACEALGIESNGPDWFTLVHQVFHYVIVDPDVEDQVVLAHTPEKFAIFKARLTEVFGIEL